MDKEDWGPDEPKYGAKVVWTPVDAFGIDDLNGRPREAIVTSPLPLKLRGGIVRLIYWNPYADDWVEQWQRLREIVRAP